MSMSDPVADFLTRIRNAHMARLPTVEARFSTLKSELARILKKEGYVQNMEVVGAGTEKVIRLTLKYYGKKSPAICGIKRVSKPGLRAYVKAKDVPRVLDGLGVAILSTSAGVLTDNEARQKGVGGELLCHVW